MESARDPGAVDVSSMSQLIEAPLAVAVLPPGRALTDAMVGAAGVLALERVAPWADVTLLESAGGLERYDAQITAHAVAGGVFIDCSVTDLVRAAGALTRGDAVQSAL